MARPTMRRSISVPTKSSPGAASIKAKYARDTDIPGLLNHLVIASCLDNDVEEDADDEAVLDGAAEHGEAFSCLFSSSRVKRRGMRERERRRAMSMENV